MDMSSEKTPTNVPHILLFVLLSLIKVHVTSPLPPGLQNPKFESSTISNVTGGVHFKSFLEPTLKHTILSSTDGTLISESKKTRPKHIRNRQQWKEETGESWTKVKVAFMTHTESVTKEKGPHNNNPDTRFKLQALLPTPSTFFSKDKLHSFLSSKSESRSPSQGQERNKRKGGNELFRNDVSGRQMVVKSSSIPIGKKESVKGETQGAEVQKKKNVINQAFHFVPFGANNASNVHVTTQIPLKIRNSWVPRKKRSTQLHILNYPGLNSNGVERSGSEIPLTTTESSSAEDHKRKEHSYGGEMMPDGYQPLFPVNIGIGGGYSRRRTNATLSTEESSESTTGAGVVYSVFVLIVVACVIFLFLVAFIGFFLVTNSINHTAHYFIPHRLRVWVVGESGEGELLAPNNEVNRSFEEDYPEDGLCCGEEEMMEEERGIANSSQRI